MNKKKNFKVYTLLILNFLYNSVAFSQNPTISFKPISKAEFENTKLDNYNANYVSKLDSTDIKKGLKAIEPYYTENEKELALSELTTPRYLTNFFAFYPNLEIYCYLIYDNHFAKACFINEKKQLLTPNYRFFGTFGAMSKDGKWFGFKREGSDNIIDIESIKITQNGVKGIMKLTFPAFDVYENRQGKTEIFWAKENTIFMLVETKNVTINNSKTNQKYYMLSFTY
jgi:hypothetical protein